MSVKIDSKQFLDSLNQYITIATTKAGEVIHKDTIKLASKVRANIITRSANGGMHLANSVMVTPSVKGGEVWVSADYAEYVEEGTSKMSGKHFVRDAVEDILGEISNDILKEAL